jgi:hypothetical protein
MRTKPDGTQATAFGVSVMLMSTLFLALIIVIAVYFVIVRLIPWAILSYLVFAGIGAAFLWAGSVHLTYVGIEVAGLGALVVWCHYRWWRRAEVAPQVASQAPASSPSAAARPRSS